MVFADDVETVAAESVNGDGRIIDADDKVDDITAETEYPNQDDKLNEDNINSFVQLDVEDTVSDEERNGHGEDLVTMETDTRALDGGWGWLIVLGALLLRTVIGGLGRSHGLFYIKFKERYNGNATSTALVTSLTGFLRLSAGPVVSILSGRFQCRLLTTLGGITIFIGLILTAFSVNLQFLYFSYGVVSGIGRALTLTPVPILLGNYFDKRRSLAFGLASAGFSIGGFAITPVVELLFQHYGYQGTFLILSGFALNILVSSALFRPIELHRRLSTKRKKTNSLEIDDVKSSLISSTDETRCNAADQSPASSLGATIAENVDDTDDKDSLQKRSDIIHVVNDSTDNSQISDCCDHIKDKETIKRHCQEMNTDVETSEPAEDDHEHYDKLINKEVNIGTGPCETQFINNTTEPVNKTNNSQGNKETKKDRKSLISWSILKDVRFLSYVFATFCFALPASALFLPALAKSKGMSEIQAASLLSMSSGFDTLFRVLSGIVLDLRIFRSIRPQIYNGVTFIQGILVALYPSMSSFTEFMVLSAADGAVQGIKNAQGSVIVMDMLGVDKLASSLAVTMTVQCVAIFLGPTISGQLIDASGSYDGAFYFASVAILIGAVVMAAGNIAKYYRDSKSAAKCMDT